MNENLGKLLIGGGLLAAGVGVVLLYSKRFPWLRLGRLPGDFAYERDGFAVYIPFTTMLLLSALATLVFWILGALKR